MNIETADIFCDVVDNFGDAGVCYRLAKSLKKELPEITIRIFTNNISAFSALDSAVESGRMSQTVKGIGILSYKLLETGSLLAGGTAGLVIEAFACSIPSNYYEKALDTECLIINLDHLSAEKWVEGVHLKESLTGRKAKKYFFMPGFSTGTGGIMQEKVLSVEEMLKKRKYFEGIFGIRPENEVVITMFTYERDMREVFQDIKNSGKKSAVIVFGEKSRMSVEPLMSMKDEFTDVIFSDFLQQEEYDDLLKVSDLNFVRGEDSWARACLSGKPFVWHAYHQDDNYQQVKVSAFNMMISDYFEDKNYRDMFCLYNIIFNDRERKKRSLPENFLTETLNYEGKGFKILSEHLIKNCNLTDNLLKFITDVLL